MGSRQRIGCLGSRRRREGCALCSVVFVARVPARDRLAAPAAGRQAGEGRGRREWWREGRVWAGGVRTRPAKQVVQGMLVGRRDSRKAGRPGAGVAEGCRSVPKEEFEDASHINLQKYNDEERSTMFNRYYDVHIAFVGRSAVPVLFAI